MLLLFFEDQALAVHVPNVTKHRTETCQSTHDESTSQNSASGHGRNFPAKSKKLIENS